MHLSVAPRFPLPFIGIWEPHVYGVRRGRLKFQKRQIKRKKTHYSGDVDLRAPGAILETWKQSSDMVNGCVKASCHDRWSLKRITVTSLENVIRNQKKTGAFCARTRESFARQYWFLISSERGGHLGLSRIGERRSLFGRWHLPRRLLLNGRSNRLWRWPWDGLFPRWLCFCLLEWIHREKGGLGDVMGDAPLRSRFGAFSLRTRRKKTRKREKYITSVLSCHIIADTFCCRLS